MADRNRRRSQLGSMFVICLTTIWLIPSCLGFTKAPANYHIQSDDGGERFFKYQTLNGQFRKEKRLDDGTQVGTYGWVDPTGLLRLYDYVADDWGYRIVNSYTENLSKGTAPYSSPGAYAPATAYSGNAVPMDTKQVKHVTTSAGKTMYGEKPSALGYAPPPPPPSVSYSVPSKGGNSGESHDDHKSDSHSGSYQVPVVHKPAVSYSAPKVPSSNYGVPAVQASYSPPQVKAVEPPKVSYHVPKPTPAPYPSNSYGPPKVSYSPPSNKDSYVPPQNSYAPPAKETYSPPPLPPKVVYSPPIKVTYSPPKAASYVPPLPKNTYSPPPKDSYSVPSTHNKGHDDDDHHKHSSPSTSYSVPVVKAHAPVVSYEAPRPSYIAPPVTSYKAPTPSYHVPQKASVSYSSPPRRTYVAVKKRPIYDPKPAYKAAHHHVYKAAPSTHYKAVVPSTHYKASPTYTAPKSYSRPIVKSYYSAPRVTSYKSAPVSYVKSAPVSYSKASSYHHKAHDHSHHHDDDHHYSASQYTPTNYKVVSVVKPGNGYDDGRKVIGYEDPDAAKYYNHHKPTHSYTPPSYASKAASQHVHHPPVYSHHQKASQSYSVPEPKVESYVPPQKGHTHHHDDHDVKNTYVPPKGDDHGHHHHKEKAGFFAPPASKSGDHHHHSHDDKNTYVPPVQDSNAHHHHHKEKAGFFAPPAAKASSHHHSQDDSSHHHEEKGGYFSPAARGYKAATSTQTPLHHGSHIVTTPALFLRGERPGSSILTPVKAEPKGDDHKHVRHHDDKHIEIPVTSYRPTVRTPTTLGFASPGIRSLGDDKHSQALSYTVPVTGNSHVNPPLDQGGIYFSPLVPASQVSHVSHTQEKQSSGEVQSVLTPPSRNAKQDEFGSLLGNSAGHDSDFDKIITKFTPTRFESTDKNVHAHFSADDHEHHLKSQAFIPPGLSPAQFSHKRKKRDVRLHKAHHHGVGHHEAHVPDRATTVFVPPQSSHDSHSPHHHVFSPAPKRMQLAYSAPVPAAASRHNTASHYQQRYHPAASSYREHRDHYLAQVGDAHTKIKDPNVLLGVYDHGADGNFRYNTGNQFHYEKTLPNGQKQGKYGYVDPFGIFRQIHYATSPYDGGLQIKKDFRFVGKEYNTSYD